MTGGERVTILAHDVGETTELPMPLSFVLICATSLVALTFAVAAFAWREPRFDPRKPGRELPRWVTRAVDSARFRWAAALAALLFTTWVMVGALFGPQDGENPLRGVLYVLLWVGLVPASLAAGPVWRVISPTRTLYRLIDAGRTFASGKRIGALRYPAHWGYWPAAMGLFAFVWLELASPNYGTLTTIKFWLLAYVAVMMGGALVYGRRWFARADPFEAYSVAVSRLSPFRRNPCTRLIVVGNPLDNLPSMPVRPGTLAVLAILLGSTAFDSLSARESIDNLIYDYEDSVPLVSGWVGGSMLRTAGLFLTIVVVAATFWVATQCTGGVDRQRRRRLPGQMAHCLIPVVVGYVLAHYLGSLVESGQDTIILLADPLDREWNLFGLQLRDANYWPSRHPAVLTIFKMMCVVTGHLIGVLAAHDKALRLLPAGHQLTGQLAMMLTMVAYTFTGLYLLLGG